MAFVKLDTAILTSSLWVSRGQRDVFVTALLMAVPRYFKEPVPTLYPRSLEQAEFVVPPGDYGFIAAAGPGIVRMALVGEEEGMQALDRLSQPDPESRSAEFDGRRLVRINGGYVVLNFDRYRLKDHNAAERMSRYRERVKERNEKSNVTRHVYGATRNITQAEAEAEERKSNPLAHRKRRADGSPPLFARFWEAYPRKVSKGRAEKSFSRINPDEQLVGRIIAAIERAKTSDDWRKDRGMYIPHPATWLNDRRWEDGESGPKDLLTPHEQATQEYGFQVV